MTDPSPLDRRDRERLEDRGIPIAEAERQLKLLRSPPQPFRLDRPCTISDGIRTLAEDERDEFASAYEEAVARGRASKLVPASGAATRMFRTLTALLAEDELPSDSDLERRRREDDPSARDLLRLRERLGEFPFAPALQEVLAREGRTPAGCDDRELLRALLGPEGLGLADRPKGLIPFHRYPDGEIRNAFEEHLAEGSRYLADEHGVARLHFTVGPEHWDEFHRAADLGGAAIGGRNTRFRIEFSTQSPSTDTLAITPEGEPFREPDGTLLLRPGGHGALLGNLAESGGDLVFLKNIDNVLPKDRHEEAAAWQRALAGLLVRTQRTIHRYLHRLDDPEDDVVSEAADWVRRTLGLDLPSGTDRERLRDRLDRPLRVAAVVENTGEPGGGPFWVERPDGAITPQIVEKAEVDLDRSDQAEAFGSSTHFNPVQIVCALRDRDGRPYDLFRFVDDDAVFVARKSHGGRPLLALERPGLWNGSMAGWNTLFVAIPGDQFAPVKTVFDLLRPAHQGGVRS